MDESIVDGNALDDGLLERWERYFLLTAEEALIDDELKVTLLDGLLHLRDDERYRNDDRYLKLWMRYADSTDDASKVFKMLRSYNIGTQLALFWAGWAYVLEKGESYSKVMGVLQQGKRRGARPAYLLEEFEGAFCRRMRERMRVARSNLAQRVIEQKTVVSVIPKRPDGTTQRSSAIREQLIDGRTSVQSLPTSSRWLQDIRCSPGPRALQEPADQRGVEAKIASGVCRSHIRHRVSRSKENQVTKTAYRRVLDAHSEAQGGTREEKRSGSADTPLRELDVNTQYQESPKFRDPGKKACRVGKFYIIRDPFSEDMRKDLTVESPQYVRWLTSNNGVVHDVRNESLTKRWPRKTGTARRGSRRRIVSAQTLGAQRLEVMGMLGKGAFAAVYACKVDARYDVAVKIELQKCTALSLPWECFVTLQLRDRLLHRCDAEPDIEVIAPTALHLFSDGSAMTMPQGRYGTVHDLVIMYQKKSQAMPQLVVMHYAIQMLRFCRVMHSASILHMDIKPDNWLLTTTKRRECGMNMNHTKTGGDGRRSSHSLSLIDFGRAIDLSVFHDNGSAVSFTGKCCPSNFSCPAMLEGREWKYDADLFALGSCIHFMLHGAYLEVDCDEGKESDSASSERRWRWRPKRQCRRYWEVNLWNHLFDELLNSDGCGNGHAKTEAILICLEQSITTFIMDGRRSLELAEFLRIQDNMFRSNS